MGKSHALVGLALVAVFFASAAQARPKAISCAESTRWASEAPIALVHGRSIESPSTSRSSEAEAEAETRSEPEGVQCPDGAPFREAGSRWSSIDRWGRIVGVAEWDDAKGGRFKMISGSRGVGVFVKAPIATASPPIVRITHGRGAKEPAPTPSTDPSARAPLLPAPAPPPTTTAAWDPPRDVRVELKQMLGERAKQVREVVFFRARPKDGGVFEYAIVTTALTLSLAQRDESGKWKIAYRDNGHASLFPLFEIRAIVDMNDDGVPEILYRFGRTDESPGYDVILGTGATPKRWRKIVSASELGAARGSGTSLPRSEQQRD